MPVYRVSTTVETVVYAADEEDARYIATEGLTSALDGAYREVERVTSVGDLPDEWTVKSLVWHAGREDLSVKDALAKGDG